MNESTTMQQKVERYLKVRRDLGYQLKIEGQQLLRFAEYCDKNKHKGPVSIEMALRWATLPVNTTKFYLARRLEIVRCFAKYQSGLATLKWTPKIER